MSTDAEVIVVGGGHNGLICAAYLARAGIDTLVLEARDDVGGCASTVTDLGARFNICHCDHTMIRAVPVIDELDLAAHGLRYLEPQAGNVHLFHDGSQPWVSFHDPEATLDGLARLYPHQVGAYRRYLADALPLARLLIDLLSTYPTAARLSARALARRDDSARRILGWAKGSADGNLRRYFDDWRLRMPAVTTGPTVWGVPPTLPATGLAALNYATRHVVRTGRPEGGSGMLPTATRLAFEAAGGRVRCGARVDGLLVDGERGSVEGVRLTTGETVRAGVVVAACDPRVVFVDWLGRVPPGAESLAERWRRHPVHDGYESKVDAVLSAPPRFAALAELEAVYPGVDLLEPSATVSPTPEELDEAHRLKAEHRVAPRPSMLVNAPTVLDPTMAPGPGQHVFSLETLFTPYALAGGWPGSGEPERWLGLWADLAEPGFLGTVQRWRAMTPDRYEAELSMHRGHAPAYVASPLTTLTGRNRELSRYRTAVAGLYLTGAATFPGAGIFGASGRNAAHVIRTDLRGPLGRRLAPLRHRAARLPRPVLAR